MTKAAQALHQQRNNGNGFSLGNIIGEKSICDAVNEYLVDCKLENRSKRTIEFYHENLVEFTTYTTDVLGLHQMSKVEPLHIKQYLTVHVGHTYALHAKYRSLRAFFNWAVRNKYVSENPLLALKSPKLPQKIVPTLKLEDLKKLINGCDKSFAGRRNRAIIFVLLDTGVRLTELTGLTIDDVNIETGLLKIKGKGNKERIVRMGTVTQKELWNYIKARGSTDKTLWLGEEKKPIGSRGIQIALYRLGKQVGLGARCNPHTFRHSFAINFLRAGGDIFNLQTLLGHSSLEMVKRIKDGSVHILYNQANRNEAKEYNRYMRLLLGEANRSRY